MKENKLTPEEIKKALECCKHSKWGDKCAECFYCECDSEKGCQKELIEDTLDLINLQQAEIKEQAKLIDRLQIENGFIKNKALAEGKTTATAIMAEYKQHRMTAEYINRLKAEIEQWKEEANRYQTLWCEDVQTARAEAIKEFAERLKKEVFRKEFHTAYGNIEMIGAGAIDDLVKEMVGEQE